MKLSRNFLNKHIDVSDIDYKELCDKLIMMGNEYESFEPLISGTNLVVGKVVECIDHPNSDKLHVCSVDVAGDELLQIVCGAPNVYKGAYVIVAMVGAVLPEITIKPSVIRDVASNGMLCSLVELGIDKKYLSDDDINGIHIFKTEVLVGSDPIKYLHLDDIVCDFELTANRGDLLSVYGFSKEVKLLTNKETIKEDISFNEINASIKDLKNVTINTDKCLKYLLKGVNNIKVCESTNEVKALLIASGIRPINNIVDISNYVMLEYGIPLHIFDADKVGDIVVETAKESEKVIALNKEEYTLDSNDIVIKSDDKIIAIAGVMGANNSCVDLNTKNIIIECAYFDSVSIRKTSKKTTRTDASNRYEKGINKDIMEVSINKACMMLSNYGDVLSDTIVYDNTSSDKNIIKISYEKIINSIGINIPVEKINEIFTSLEFCFELNDGVYTLTIPSHKIDINIYSDVIEEVARCYGYDNIHGVLPKLSGKKSRVTYKQKLINDTKNYFVSAFFNETVSYTLTSNENTKLFTNETTSLEIINHISTDRKYLRTSIIPSLIEIYEYNKKRGNKDLAIFEVSGLYKTNCTNTRVSALMCGEYITNKWNNTNLNADFYLLKGIVCNYLNYLGFNGRYKIIASNDIKGMHPFMSASILIDNKTVGFIGKIHPSINKNNIYIFDMDIDLVSSINIRDIKNKEISKFPSIVKDFSLLLDENIKADDVVNVILKTAGRIVSDAYVFDVFNDETIENTKKSYSFKITFMDPKKTLTNEEVMVIFNKVIDKLVNEFNAILRDGK